MKFRQGRFDEAAEWIAVGKEHTAVDDFDAQLLWMPVSAKVSARRGDLGGAIAMASDAAALAETTDGLNRRAVVQSDLGVVLQLAGRASEGAAAFTRAISLFDAKGNVVGAARVQSIRDELALV